MSFPPGPTERDQVGLVGPAGRVGHVEAERQRVLFFNVCVALASGRLRLKPRERQFCLLLAVESFGRGAASGRLDCRAMWRRLGWHRESEVVSMLEEWRRAGWIAVDALVYRLAPDTLPGWAECFRPSFAMDKSAGDVERELPLRTEDHVASVMCELSQERACESLAPGDVVAEIPQRGCGNSATHVQNVSERLSVETFERLNVNVSERSRAREGAAHGQNGKNGTDGNDGLRARVRAFVGDADWASERFWNSGRGWRGRIFEEEAAALQGALDYLVAGLRDGAITIRKTRGAMLWDQFQRERNRQLNHL